MRRVAIRKSEDNYCFLQAYNYVGTFMSLSGGFCSISCSLLLPSLFYFILYRHQSNKSVIVALSTLIVIGTVLLVFITSQNISDIVSRNSQTSASDALLGNHALEFLRET